MQTKSNINYRDLILSGDINSKYHNLINFEVQKNPYSRKLSKSSFSLKTRRGMIPALDGLPQGGEITDSIEIYNEDTDVYDRYIMRVDDYNRHEMKIFKINGCNATQIGKTQCIRKGGMQKFIKTKFVKGKPRNVYADLIPEVNGEDGIQINSNTYTTRDYDIITGEVREQVKIGESELEFSESITTQGGNAGVRTVINTPPDGLFGLPELTEVTSDGHTFNFQTLDTNSIQVGDYLLVYGLNAGQELSKSGVPTQVNIVTGTLNPLALNVRNARAGFYPKQYAGRDCKFRVFPEWGDVFLIDTCDGLKLWTWDMDDITLDDDFLHTGFTEEQSKNIGENAGILMSVNKNGYLRYGGYDTLKFYGSLTQTVYIGTDVIATPTFQEYTLLFRRKGLSIIRFSLNATTGKLEYQYAPTDLNVGLFSKDAYDLYRSSFYFIGSNKRLYALTIKPSSTGSYETDLQDMSAIVKGELDNIGPTDRVFLQATEQNLKIFIVGDWRDNGRSIKTKVLVFDKDYQFWHRREFCNMVITKEVDGAYIGSSYYNQCGYSDNGTPIESRAEAFLGECEVGSPSNYFQNKNITGGSFALGHGSYLSNENFKVEVDMHTNGLKTTFRLDAPEGENGIDYVNLLRRFRTGELTKPSEDMLQLISSCSNFDHPCDGSGDSYDILKDSDKCGCPDEIPQIDDYCVCLDDKKYFLSPLSVVHFNMKGDNNRSRIIKLTISASGGDILEFGGAVIPFWIKAIEDRDMFYPNEWTCFECAVKDPCLCENSDREPCGLET